MSEAKQETVIDFNNTDLDALILAGEELYYKPLKDDDSVFGGRVDFSTIEPQVISFGIDYTDPTYHSKLQHGSLVEFVGGFVHALAVEHQVDEVDQSLLEALVLSVGVAHSHNVARNLNDAAKVAELQARQAKNEYISTRAALDNRARELEERGE